jgi:hypothetical protein
MTQGFSSVKSEFYPEQNKIIMFLLFSTSTEMYAPDIYKQRNDSFNLQEI